MMLGPKHSVGFYPVVRYDETGSVTKPEVFKLELSLYSYSHLYTSVGKQYKITTVQPLNAATIQTMTDYNLPSSVQCLRQRTDQSLISSVEQQRQVSK